jgi:ribonuclease BN (tRNA processing enzyme)
VSPLRVTVVGCSGSVPGPESAASCYLVTAHDADRTWQLLLDLGNGALGALQRHLDPLALDAIALSHLHADHCFDLSGLAVWRSYHPEGTPSTVLPVHGPPGTEQRLARAVAVDGPTPLAGRFAFADLQDRASFTVGPMTVTPFGVRHPVPAFGFRVEAGGAVLAYTGDTDSCPALRPLMAGADLVLADSAFVDGRDDASPGVHLSGSRAARAAVDAGGVRRLVLTHLPPWNDPEVCRAQAEAHWPGRVELAAPGQVYELAGDTARMEHR